MAQMVISGCTSELFFHVRLTVHHELFIHILFNYHSSPSSGGRMCFFPPNATKCPLWTSWSPLPAVAEAFCLGAAAPKQKAIHYLHMGQQPSKQN
jgi:hypothetical protein